jgi:hypothetical protein
MKIVAFAANVAQLAIILLIFFVRGMDLGTPIIFLLFLLMTVPFINFVSLLFDNRRIWESGVPKVQERGMIKREAKRIYYPGDHCPTLRAGNSAFAVIDLSEGGVRISAVSTTPFKKRISGDIQLLCGERLPFKARLLRQEKGEAAFRFNSPIGTAILMEEKKVLAAPPLDRYDRITKPFSGDM